TAVNQINERNLVIASAPEEQAQMAQEVNRNLVNIRDLSTESAAGAEQTSAASRELARLAVELNQLITRFRTCIGTGRSQGQRQAHRHVAVVCQQRTEVLRVLDQDAALAGMVLGGQLA